MRSIVSRIRARTSSSSISSTTVVPLDLAGADGQRLEKSGSVDRLASRSVGDVGKRRDLFLRAAPADDLVVDVEEAKPLCDKLIDFLADLSRFCEK